MKTIVVLILVVSILLSGCVGVDGKPLTFQTQFQKDESFVEGCLASIFFLTSPQNLPPIEDAVLLCGNVLDLYRELEAENATPVCEGDCL